MEGRPKAVDIVTLPYPGFPTDLQPQYIALNSIADGAALVTENLFEARFRFVRELARLGADVRTDGHHALIRGKAALSGAPVEATDIRAGRRTRTSRAGGRGPNRDLRSESHRSRICRFSRATSRSWRGALSGSARKNFARTLFVFRPHHHPWTIESAGQVGADSGLL